MFVYRPTTPKVVITAFPSVFRSHWYLRILSFNSISYKSGLMYLREPAKIASVVISLIQVFELVIYENICVCHCVKSVQIRNYFWFVFSCILTEYGEYRKIQARTNFVFGHFSRSAFNSFLN